MARTSTDIQTTVKNTSGGTLHFGFLPPHGRTLTDGEEVTFDGDLTAALYQGGGRSVNRRSAALKAALVAGDLAIVSSPPPVLRDDVTEEARTLSFDDGGLELRNPSWDLLDDSFSAGGGSDSFIIEDDFTHYTADDRWALVTAVDGTVTLADAVGGKVAILSAAVTAGNEDTYLVSNAENYKFAVAKPIVYHAIVDFTEGFTDQANILAGLMDGVASGALQNDGAGPKASYSGAVFFKVDGETVWHCETSIGATQETTETEVTAGGATAQKLSITFTAASLTTGTVNYYIDDVLVATHEDVDITAATEMQLVFGVKDGDATDEETLNVDYVYCRQKR